LSGWSGLPTQAGQLCYRGVGLARTPSGPATVGWSHSDPLAVTASPARGQRRGDSEPLRCHWRSVAQRTGLRKVAKRPGIAANSAKVHRDPALCADLEPRKDCPRGSQL